MPRFRGEDEEDDSEGGGRHSDRQGGRVGDGKLWEQGDYAGKHAKTDDGDEDEDGQ